MRYMICHWATNRSDPQNLLSITLDVPLQWGYISLTLFEQDGLNSAIPVL